MKRLTKMMGLALICAIACNAVKGQDSAAMMKAWMDYMTPGAMHSMLAKDNGTWNAQITMWMAPDAPPQKSTGTAVYKMIMGGRYQQGEFKSTFNGMPFEGMSTVAYDNSKKAFVSTWLDNMGTGIMNMEGTYDEATKTYNFSGNSYDPMTGKQCAFRQTIKRVDDNTLLEEMFATYPGAKEFKTMEITFKRKK
jgi:hypothetical protein